MKLSTQAISKLSQIVSLLITIFLISIIAINRDNQILGVSIEENDKESSENITYYNDTLIINTSKIVTGIKGYAGNTPLEIHITPDGYISNVIPLKNLESPRFFKSLEKKGLYSQWIGLTADEAIEKRVDAISGATVSSNAVIKTFKAGLQYALDNDVIPQNEIMEFFSIKNILAILVILIAVIVPIFAKNKVYRYIQLITNIIILGVWCGTFLSLSMIINFISNGFNSIEMLIPLLFIIIAFILPLFNKKQHYCSWVCPYGASQEIIHSISPFKIKISNKCYKLLKAFQKILWTIIILILCLGIYSEIMDYEAISIFIINQVDVPILIIGSLFLLLSLFVKRPYCKFVCPTGYTLKLAEKSNFKRGN